MRFWVHSYDALTEVLNTWAEVFYEDSMRAVVHSHFETQIQIFSTHCPG